MLTAMLCIHYILYDKHRSVNHTLVGFFIIHKWINKGFIILSTVPLSGHHSRKHTCQNLVLYNDRQLNGLMASLFHPTLRRNMQLATKLIKLNMLPMKFKFMYYNNLVVFYKILDIVPIVLPHYISLKTLESTKFTRRNAAIHDSNDLSTYIIYNM